MGIVIQTLSCPNLIIAIADHSECHGQRARLGHNRQRQPVLLPITKLTDARSLTFSINIETFGC